ncbi:hypothetical protein V6N13_105604 [Hibiscus sabdariffa]
MGKGEGTCAVEVVGANEVAGSFLIPGCRRGSLRQLSCCHRKRLVARKQSVAKRSGNTRGHSKENKEYHWLSSRN